MAVPVVRRSALLALVCLRRARRSGLVGSLARALRGECLVTSLGWPEAFHESVLAVCWTFLAWRVGAGAFARWKENW